MFYIGIFMISWLVAGFIGSVPKLLDKEFQKETIKELAEEKGFPAPKNPTLFWVAGSTLFGYYSLYRELRNQLSNLLGR